jgi:hypothetical protein
MNTEVQISPKDLGSIPRPVATVVCELVNQHGVKYRMQNNGGHVYLYNGGQGRPYKISASRPAETTLSFLHKWIEENVPGFGKEPEHKAVTPADVAKLAAVVNTEPRPVATKQPDEEWREAKFGFVTNGKIFRCTQPGCEYEREDNKGLHLHAYAHDGRSSGMSKKAAESRALNEQQKEQLIEAAVSTIAEQFGLVVVPKAQGKVSVEKLQRENEALRKEVEDLKARIDLITTALKA